MAPPYGTVGKLGYHVQEKNQACEVCPVGASCPSGNGVRTLGCPVCPLRGLSVFPYYLTARTAYLGAGSWGVVGGRGGCSCGTLAHGSLVQSSERGWGHAPSLPPWLSV